MGPAVTIEKQSAGVVRGADLELPAKLKNGVIASLQKKLELVLGAWDMNSCCFFGRISD